MTIDCLTAPPNFSIMIPALRDQLSQGQLWMLADMLRRGGVVWFPSDCSYALTADPRHPTGIAAMDLLLDHSGHPIPLCVGNVMTAATVIRFNETVQDLTGVHWPGGLGIHTKPASRAAARIARRLHAPDGSVVRMSESVIERQISDTTGMAMPSAAMRRDGRLIGDSDEALALAIELNERSTPGHPTVFIRHLGAPPRVAQHSTMVAVSGTKITVLRHGAVDLSPTRTALSHYGVDWSSAT